MIEIVPEYFPLEEEFRRSRVSSGGMMSRRAMSLFVKNPLQVAETIEKIFEDDLHARRVLSLANCVVGTLDAAVLSIHAIGRGYAHATNNNEKHGVKQTDRMIGNTGINVWLLFHPWAKFVVGGRKEVVVALDWTEFDADDHATLAGYLITSHGRATPLIWMTVRKSTLEGKRNDHEYRLIERLHACLAADVKITLLADRGFGDQKLYRFLEALGWDFIIRFRGGIKVESAEGGRKPAADWVPANGRATMIRKARVTRTRAEVPAVVVVHARKMKEAWCLATSLSERKAAEVVKLYARRFTIEETFRDQKNLRFGMGLSGPVGDPHRNPRPTRSPASRRSHRASVAHTTRRCRRAMRSRSADENQHVQETHDVLVQPRHQPLRRHSQHGGRPTRAADESVRLSGPRA